MNWMIINSFPKIACVEAYRTMYDIDSMDYKEISYFVGE